jgi:hypothetical protein
MFCPRPTLLELLLLLREDDFLSDFSRVGFLWDEEEVPPLPVALTEVELTASTSVEGSSSGPLSFSLLFSPRPGIRWYFASQVAMILIAEKMAE